MFEEIRNFLKPLGFELSLLIGGFCGAFVSNSKNKKITFLQRSTSIISGGLIANYLTPFLVDKMNLNGSSSYGAAFILGYIGLKGVEMLIDYIYNKFNSTKIK